MRTLLRFVVLLALLATPALASAEGNHSLTYRNVVVLQMNPVLLRDQLSIDYQYRLYESANPYLRNNFLGFALRPTISPGFARIGGAVEVAPASVARLGLALEQVSYFGSFGQLQGFVTPDDDHSDTTLSARREAGENYAASGTVITSSLLLQNRFGPFIVRDLFELHRVGFALQADDEYFYDPTLDILMPSKGWAFTNDADVLYISPFGLIIGLRYTLTKALYGTDSDPNGPTHRIGPSFSYVVFQNPGSAFDSATLFVLLNWWLKHRWRTGEDVSQGFPFLSVGFSFTGEIL